MLDLRRSRCQTAVVLTSFLLLAISFSCKAMANIIEGSAGRDLIVTGANAAQVTAGRGDDFMIGGSNNDTYIINKDDGSDLIYETAGTNTVQFGTGIVMADIASGLI